PFLDASVRSHILQKRKTDFIIYFNRLTFKQLKAVPLGLGPTYALRSHRSDLQITTPESGTASKFQIPNAIARIRLSGYNLARKEK
ncbi:MAG: hypothetical protein WC627_05555, partial [Legionella sp.]